PPVPVGAASLGRAGPRPARRAARASPASFRAGGASRRARGRAQHGDRSPPRAAATLLDPRQRVGGDGAAKRPRRHVVSPPHGSPRRTELARASGSPGRDRRARAMGRCAAGVRDRSGSASAEDTWTARTPEPALHARPRAGVAGVAGNRVDEPGTGPLHAGELRTRRSGNRERSHPARALLAPCPGWADTRGRL